MTTDCTGLSASWCPNHGNCVCAGELDDPRCPLHGHASNHPILDYQWWGTCLEFTVLDPPVGQGRITCRSIRGKAIGTHSNAPALKRWRSVVAGRARIAMEITPWVFPIVAQPVALSLVYTMPRPASVRRDHPIVKSTANPDIDHLERAILDALSKLVIGDDALVLEVHHLKTYPSPGSGAHRLALDVPGVRIRITTMQRPPLRQETDANEG